MRTLVTGAAGFVGRHIVPELYRRGHELELIDLVDGTDVRDYFRTAERRFDLVIHLAAVVGGRATIEGAPLEVAVDLAIDAELAGWALRTRPGRIVYYSSSAAYPVHLQTGDPPYRLREDDLAIGQTRRIGLPDLTYGWSKVTGEMLALFLEAEGIAMTVLRPFSGYGVGQDLSYPFRALLERARRREDPFVIWGDGSTVRDWVHIDDVIGATFAAIESDYRGPLNVCTGRPTSFAELAGIFAAAAGYAPALELKLDAPRGVNYRVGDPSALHRVYLPAIELEDAVAAALRDA